MQFLFGTREWFEEQFKNAGTTGEDNWGHQWRASVKYKYRLITRFLAQSGFPGRRSSQRLLDIGCGLGDLTHQIYQLNPGNEVTGIDIAKNAISAAQKKYPNLQFMVDEIPALSAVIPPFDGIICIATLYYLDPPARIKALKRIHEILQPDGWLLCSVPLAYMHDSEFFELITQGNFKITEKFYTYATLSNSFERPFMKFRRFPKIFSLIRKMKILEANWLAAFFYWLGGKYDLKSNLIILAQKA